MATYFSDNFEDNTLDAWTTKTSPWATSNVQAHAGTYAARYTRASASDDKLEKVMAAEHDNVAVSFWVYFHATVIPDDVTYCNNINGDKAFQLAWTYSAPNARVNMTVYNDAAAGTALGIKAVGALDAWHEIKVVMTTAATNGGAELFIDSASQGFVNVGDNSDRGGVQAFAVYGGYAANSDFYIDDVLIADPETVTDTRLVIAGEPL